MPTKGNRKRKMGVGSSKRPNSCASYKGAGKVAAKKAKLKRSKKY